MNDKIQTRSTSPTSAIGEDIEIRITNKTRLIFRPELVTNPRNPKASVKGTFIYQVKNPSGAWADSKSLPLTTLKSGDWLKLEIHSEELLKLFNELDNYYQIYAKDGIKLGINSYIRTPKDLENIFQQLLQDKKYLKMLKNLQIDDLNKLNLAANISGLKKIHSNWILNTKNSNEAYWQKLFEENSAIIAQVFSAPTILLGGKAYLGGKGIQNTGGNIIDFLYKNSLTENALLVEIKTPTTNLLGTNYRNNCFSISTDLSGTITQILTYKHQLERDYKTLASDSSDIFEVFNPRCLIVIGTFKDAINTKEKIRSLELFRRELKNVEVITFDELFNKIELLIKLLEQ